MFVPRSESVYFAAFAWTLLNSIADIQQQPPKLRPHREIKWITKSENEAVSYFFINVYILHKAKIDAYKNKCFFYLYMKFISFSYVCT